MSVQTTDPVIAEIRQTLAFMQGQIASIAAQVNEMQEYLDRAPRLPQG